MAPDFDLIAEETLQNTDDESVSSFTEALHFTMDPILDDSTPIAQSRRTSEISLKPPTSGKRHSIMGTGNRSSFRKPNISDLKERYRKAKERVKEWNMEKMWGSSTQRAERDSLASLSEIVKAAFWIPDGVPKTPCERAAYIPEIHNVEVYFKREYTNPSGSYHDRGVRYALLRLPQFQKNVGVISTSTGNHAIALAYHGHSLGIPVTVLLPENTSPVKIRLCEKYDADTRIGGQEEREVENKIRENAKEIETQRGLAFIDEDDNPDIVCGLGTMGLEIVDQLEGIDAVIVPTDGKSHALLAGTCVAVKTLYPSIEIIAVKSERSVDYKVQLVEGKTLTTKESKEVASAEGSGYNELEIRECPSKLAESLMDKCITVKKDHIAQAVLRLLEYEKVIVEANGAAGLAALIGGYLPELSGKRVVVVLSEGNMDPALLPRVIARGLTTDGRLVRFEVRIDDRLGTMATLLRLVTSTGAVIKDVSQEPAWNEPSFVGVQAKVTVEVSGRDHAGQLKCLLDKNFLVTFWSCKTDSAG